MKKVPVSCYRSLVRQLKCFPSDLDSLRDQFFMGYITALLHCEKINVTSYNELCDMGVDGYIEFSDFIGI